MRVRELAALVGGAFEGNGDLDIRSVAPVESAGPGEIAFLAGRKFERRAQESGASCLIVTADHANREGRTIIRVSDPRAAAARVIARLYPVLEAQAGIHPSAVLGPGVVTGKGVSIGAHTSIGAAVHIGAGSSIGSGCAIGDHVQIGEHCMLHANVTVYHDVSVGHRTILHSGCVLGADGFGFVLAEGIYEKFPQVGRVEIGNDVEIGANAAVDRAALGVTSIGDGTKLDNMVHVGHNCRIGRHVVVAAQTGFSGGVMVDDYAVIGGQVGVGDKAHIESRAVIGSGAGILTSKIVRAGQVVWGTPARPLKQYLEQLALLARLHQVRKEMHELKKRVAELLDRS